MTARLAGRTAVVTGGSSGIGAAIVAAFLAEGAGVAFCHHRDSAGATEVVAAAGTARVVAVDCDLADPAQAGAFWSQAEAALGPIDILVNNAGVGGLAPFEEIELAAFDRMIAVNLRAMFQLAQLAVPAMRRRGWGRIINIASQLAHSGAPGLVHYCTTKAGVIGMTRALALELAQAGVRVNAIAPGFVDTPATRAIPAEWTAAKIAALPIGRAGVPGDIAPTAVLLASTDGDFYVGQTLSPNGGDVLL